MLWRSKTVSAFKVFRDNIRYILIVGLSLSEGCLYSRNCNSPEWSCKTLDNKSCRPLSIKFIAQVVQGQRGVRGEEYCYEIDPLLFLCYHVSTIDKCACSGFTHCDPSAIYSVITYYGDCCHEDASSYALNHSRKQERISGGDRPLKLRKVILFIMILYNSEGSICDIRPFCHPLFCHSSVVKSSLSALQ